jgi:ribonuclease HI
METQEQTIVPDPKHWTLHFDESKRLQGSRASIILTAPKGDKLSYVLQIHFSTTNNVAEYEALLHGLRITKGMGITRIMCYGDSSLVAWQVSSDFDANDPNMAAYRATIDKMEESFIGYEVHHIKRADNNVANALFCLGSSCKAVPSDVFLEHLHKPSVKGVDSNYPESSDPPLQVMIVAPDWTVPFLEYLVDRKLSTDEFKSQKIVHHSKGYTIIDEHLYKRSTIGVFQQCVDPKEARYILEEIHSGDCGHHAAPRALVAKAFRHGFYWLTAKANTEEIIDKCKGCQFYARQAHLPAQDLQPILLTWSFVI